MGHPGSRTQLLLVTRSIPIICGHQDTFTPASLSGEPVAEVDCRGVQPLRVDGPAFRS